MNTREFFGVWCTGWMVSLSFPGVLYNFDIKLAKLVIPVLPEAAEHEYHDGNSRQLPSSQDGRYQLRLLDIVRICYKISQD